MIGWAVGKILNGSEERLSAETWERNYRQLMQQYTAEVGHRRRLETELAAEKQRFADLASSASGDTRRVVAENARLRKLATDTHSRCMDLQLELKAAAAAIEVAESALALAQQPPVAGDRWKTEAERHRAAAARLDGENERLRRLVDEFEVDMAALRERLDKYERATPK